MIFSIKIANNSLENEISQNFNQIKQMLADLDLYINNEPKNKRQFLNTYLFYDVGRRMKFCTI